MGLPGDLAGLVEVDGGPSECFGSKATLMGQEGPSGP